MECSHATIFRKWNFQFGHAGMSSRYLFYCIQFYALCIQGTLINSPTANMSTAAFQLIIRNSTVVMNIDDASEDVNEEFYDTVRDMTEDNIYADVESGYMSFYVPQDGAKMAISYGTFNLEELGMITMHVPIFVQGMEIREVAISPTPENGPTHEFKVFFKFAVAKMDEMTQIDQEPAGSVRQDPNQDVSTFATLKMFV